MLMMSTSNHPIIDDCEAVGSSVRFFTCPNSTLSNSVLDFKNLAGLPLNDM
jgi:hypothetical protein